MKQNVFFVSGIDTDIGKSYATAYLAHLWNKQGCRTITQKFIQTGNPKAASIQFLQKHRNRHGMNVDATQTGIVFQYHQVQMIVGISCLVVVFQDVLNQGRYRFQIFQTETSLIRIDYHKLITCLELQPSTQKLLNVELISLIKV